MEAISSIVEEVSSMLAACSEAPDARDWLASETWFEAEDTWLEISVTPSITVEIDRTIIRVMNHPIANDKITPAPSKT
jgi:uncharacterized alpha-E superfamily protein